MVKYYTFSAKSLGTKYYPIDFQWKREDCPAGTGLLDFDWTDDINKARRWANREDVELIANEYYDTEIVTFEEYKKSQKFIYITNTNEEEKFVSFKLEGMDDGITVGLYPNNDGLVISYKGDQTGVLFNADSSLIKELNDPSFPNPEDIEN